ncbi:hypothetical protein BpHYR1_052772 [Brachionus plicatilis]|uniref:Uncharacterized protein n=1 Tax=Brachionus plicatilis TaxID=10195 RepID=A0A3M7T1F8_BRAPC|nr:hypothetical protein BpHYR1_052772 [Brachionus plicatilis]
MIQELYYNDQFLFKNVHIFSNQFIETYNFKFDRGLMENFQKFSPRKNPHSRQCEILVQKLQYKKIFLKYE